jgi:hypothetical protein
MLGPRAKVGLRVNGALPGTPESEFDPLGAVKSRAFDGTLSTVLDRVSPPSSPEGSSKPWLGVWSCKMKRQRTR